MNAPNSPSFEDQSPSPVVTPAPRRRSSPRATSDTPWLQGRVPDGYWDFHENRVAYLNWLGNRLCYKDPGDWYAIHRQDFLRNHGGGLFRIWYDSSPYNAMRDYMPEYDWKPWLFGGAPSGYWHDVENRRTFMRWLGEQLGYTCADDWYRVRRDDFFRFGGAGLLNNQYDGQVQKAIREYLPEYPFQEWLFANVPRGFWNRAENRHRFMSWMGNQLGFQSPEDWYRVRRSDYERFGGAGMLVGYFTGSIMKSLKDYIPEFNWSQKTLNRRRSAKPVPTSETGTEDPGVEPPARTNAVIPAQISG